MRTSAAKKSFTTSWLLPRRGPPTARLPSRAAPSGGTRRYDEGSGSAGVRHGCLASKLPMLWDPSCHEDHPDGAPSGRSEEHTSELQSLMRISYAVFCLKNKKKTTNGGDH